MTQLIKRCETLTNNDEDNIS